MPERILRVAAELLFAQSSYKMRSDQERVGHEILEQTTESGWHGVGIYSLALLTSIMTAEGVGGTLDSSNWTSCSEINLL